MITSMIAYPFVLVALAYVSRKGLYLVFDGPKARCGGGTTKDINIILRRRNLGHSLCRV